MRWHRAPPRVARAGGDDLVSTVEATESAGQTGESRRPPVGLSDDEVGSRPARRQASGRPPPDCLHGEAGGDATAATRWRSRSTAGPCRGGRHGPPPPPGPTLGPARPAAGRWPGGRSGERRDPVLNRGHRSRYKEDRVAETGSEHAANAWKYWMISGAGGHRRLLRAARDDQPERRHPGHRDRLRWPPSCSARSSTVRPTGWAGTCWPPGWPASPRRRGPEHLPPHPPPALPFPSAGDACSLAGYLLVFAGILRLTRSPDRATRREDNADAAILAIGRLAVWWQFLMDSYVHDASLATAPSWSPGLPGHGRGPDLHRLRALLFGRATSRSTSCWPRPWASCWWRTSPTTCWSSTAGTPPATRWTPCSSWSPS